MKDLELKNTITDARKPLDELLKRIKMKKENVSKLDHRSIKTI